MDKEAWISWSDLKKEREFKREKANIIDNAKPNDVLNLTTEKGVPGQSSTFFRMKRKPGSGYSFKHVNGKLVVEPVKYNIQKITLRNTLPIKKELSKMDKLKNFLKRVF